MTTLQKFKENDVVEDKVAECLMPFLVDLGEQRDEFFEDAFNAYPLGDTLYELGRDPIVPVLSQEIYRASFPAIHKLFTRPGTFEFYLDLFRSIWGPDVVIDFDVPEPGVLTINVEALDTYEFNFAAREIVDDEYEYNEIIDQEGDELMFIDTTGIRNQEEIDALINEVKPVGITVITTLTL